MFFQGSLQDGIALAVQQSKLVACFVTDDGEESKQWENEFLTDDSLKLLLESQAVVLRLAAGSEEAGFLEALFPVPQKPTVVVIQNGQLKEYLHAGTTKEDFVRRIGVVLRQATGQGQPAAPAPVAPAEQAIDQTLSQLPSRNPTSTSSNDLDDLYDDVPAISGQAQRELADRRAEEAKAKEEKEAKVKAEKEAKAKGEREAKAKAEREARARKLQEANESNKSGSSSNHAAERSYAEEIRQKKLQAAEERKRILKRIEDDKLERRRREVEEKQARLLLSGITQSEDSPSPTSPTSLPRRQGPASTSSNADHCNIQVRLFDGSTIRSRFKSDSTLAGDVREWVDAERTDIDEGGNAPPYTFRVVLTPLPNRAIRPSEESETLTSLDLVPSATLVLVPSRYAAAYAGVAGPLFVWRGLSYLLGLFGTGYGLLIGALGGITSMLFGRGGRPPRTQRRRETGGEDISLRDLPSDSASASRIRGFRNPDDERRNAQLYNGNSLNFEPRRDEDEGNDGNGGRD
ncbi:hypothetical protein GGS23DRAFT_177802 [Durotheca rogersii]|uniref:uncharacterized protein n=1 Tax=Durotheca rogersii TaxID=419775 RepID=UPI0022206CDE|nr:uncharacterized protein GGS23DRAFT_177802 [Durotheca rogersii]KAI5867437.1 hypothetical protein GGS23DRAFT_177802 [Durotheca rogersii]